MLKAHKRIYEASLARIFDIDGIRPIAAALFINEKYLLTPAHVIYQRVHKKKISFDYDYRGKLKEKDFINVRVLGQKIPVDFPFKDNNQRFEAEVVPKSLNFDNNVIILKLKDTSSFNNEIVPLSFDDNLTGHLFSSYPFSMPNIDKKDERYKDKIDERWVTDKVMSYTSDGLFRLGGAIKLDYLGSSVWDEDLEKFIGIIINGKLDEIGLPVETYMLPFSKIENYLLDSLSSPTELEKPIVYPPVPVVGRGSPIVLQRVSEILSEDRKPCLNADKYAEALANTLNGARGEICFAVFGHWGRGKTYLMQKVARILSQGDYECVEFSAWKYRVKPELWIYLYETLRKKALMIENTYELDANKNNFIKTITRTIFPFLRKIKIYLVKHGLWKGVFFPIVIALPLLGGIPLGLTTVFLGLIFVFCGLLLPFRLALLYFGISRQITMFTGISGKSFQISEHAEKLGLQETVGEDLRHLLFGWVGFSKKNKKFINKFIRFWNDINLFFYFCLGIIASVLFHLNVGRTDSVWETDIKPLWMIISQKEFFIKMVSYSSDFPVFGDKLTSLWDLLKKYISVTVPPLINTLKWGAFFLPTFIFALLYWFDRKKSKVLLIVDDLDRLDSYEILDIIESLKLLLEDRRFSDLIQVVIICERISLKRAFRRKYEGIYYTQVDAENETLKYSHDGLSLEQLIEENIQKLFISHIYLPPLGEDERKTVLEHFLKDDDDDENEKIQHGLELNPNSSNRNISNRSKERKKIIPQFDFNSIFKDNAKPKEAPSQVALDEMLYANDVSENSEPSNVDRFNEKKRSSNNSLNYSDRPNNPLDDNDRKALREGFEKLSDWVTLGPRAIQSYIFRYQLARELLLTAREEKYINASKLARNLALKLSGKPLETDLDENMKAVLSEVA